MKKVIVFSGAGLSAESGIPTFRDGGGLWENHRVEDVADPQGWVRDRDLVLKFYEARFNSCQSVQPNEGHKALARLEEKYEVIHITQNVDNLLERAGCTNVTHLHGQLGTRRCEWHSDGTTLDGDPKYTCDYRAAQTEPVKAGDLCPKCGGHLRPDVVWFGEAVDFNYELYRDLAKELKYGVGGHFIAVGTSGQVHPAAFLIPLFAQVPSKFIVNPDARTIANYTLCKGKAGDELPKLVDKLLAHA